VSRPLVCAAVLVLCLAAAAAAWAEGLLGGDPRGDAKGTSALDIASVGQGYQAQLLAHRLTTYRRWRGALLAKGGEISFYFNTDADAALERRLDVRFARGTLSAVMRDPRGRVVGPGLVRQPSRNTVVVTFAPSLLPAGIRSYRWFAFAGYRCRHRYKVCGDRAPNGGRLIPHRLATQPEPKPIAGQGYNVTFADEFGTLDRRVWCSHQWWEPTPRRGTQYVHDGILHVVSRRANGYPNNTITSERCGQANPKSFRQGYFESRMKWTAGNGSTPAFWLLSTRHASNPAYPRINPFCAQRGLPHSECLTSELDVFEGQGHLPRDFSGALHRNTAGFYGESDEYRQVYTRGLPDMTQAFHTYSAKWTASEVCWYLDESRLGCRPTYASTNQPMHLLFYQWPQSWARDPDRTSPDELHIEVDWVRVWQR
jgi:beta-glucanase (GH16 family)